MNKKQPNIKYLPPRFFKARRQFKSQYNLIHLGACFYRAFCFTYRPLF